MTASVAYVAFMQASWVVLVAALLALVILMALVLMFLAGLLAIIKSWRWRA